ncbi:MAG: AsmA family protein [Nitrosomonas sp.]|nr:AsmA family protein [Nitrosomonas sp.]
MNRVIKFSLVTLIIITILLAGLFFYLTVLITPKTYNHLITALTKEKIQRHLKVDGDIKLSFFPRLGINIEQLSLSEHQSNRQFASVENINLSLLLQPLLQNKLVIDNITINGLNAQLIRFEDGRSNIDDLLTTGNESAPIEFDIARLQVEKSALIFHDAMNKQHYRLSNLSLKTGKISNERIANITFETLGSMRNTTSNDQYNFFINLESPNLQFNIDHIASSKIDLITKITHSEHNILGKFSFSNLTKTACCFNIAEMMIKILARNVSQTVKTHVSSSLTGDLNAQKLHLPDLKAKFNITTDTSSNQLIRGNLKGNISMSNLSEIIDADLIGNVENRAIQATFHIAGFDKPAVNFDLDIDHLNPDRIHINTDKADLKPTTTQSLEETIDSFLLSNINVNGSVHIGTAQLADTVLSGIKLTIQSNNIK